MNANDISKGILKSLGILSLILIGVYFLWLIKSVIGFIFIAFALSLIGRPLMSIFTRRLKLGNTVAAIFTLTFIIFIFLGLIALAIPLIVEQAKNLSLLNYDTLVLNISNQIADIDLALEDKGIDIIKNNDPKKLFSFLYNTDFSNHINNIFQYFSEIILALFSVLFITFYFLKEKDLFNKMIIGAVPDKEETKVSLLLTKTKDLLTNYFVGLLIQVFIMFIIYIIVLMSFGINNALLIALFCALLNLIPYLGPLIGFGVFVLLSMSSMFVGGLDIQTQIIPNLVWIGILYFIAQLIDNFINQPIIYSKSVKSHPLEIFIVLLISGLLFGIVGVIFAIPGYTVIRVVLKTFFSNFKIVQSITKNL